MAMTTQAYVAEMQTINPASVQQVQQVQQVVRHSQAQLQTQQSQLQTQQSQQQQQQTSVQTVQVTNHPKTSTQSNSQPTVIQPAHSGQQFIVTISSDPPEQQVQETVQLQQGTSQQVVYQTHQYVQEGSSDPTIYSTPNGQMQSYTDYSQATMYTPVPGSYFQTQTTDGSQQMSTNQQLGGLQGQLVSHQGGTYLVQGGMMDGEGHPLTHTTRASPATELNSSDRMPHFDVKSWQREVQWLIDNYETAEGVSLPRSTLYNHYLRHCQEQKMDPMNPASFGKLIRSVFLGLRTRRLGTRGNSKYHYYGIRIKATSPLNQFTDDQTMALRQTPVNQGKRFKTLNTTADGFDGVQNSSFGDNQQQHQQFLGDASGAIPAFSEIELGDEPLPEGITMNHLKVFETLYKEHCEAILDIVVNLQFSLIEALWQTFWRNAPTDMPQCDSDLEQRLSKTDLLRMCSLMCVQKYVRSSDYAFYQALVEVLIPDVLRPIPSSLTQAIRNFAKSLEGWLKNAMSGVTDSMVRTKVGSVSAFAQTLRRYTSLNHLAQAARAVLQNTTQISQMLADLNRVDFANVQEQASWVCQCSDAVVHQLEQDFKKTLQQQNSLEQWADWLEGVVNQVLKAHEGSADFPKAARQFLLKWSFYSSMVIRDLTLRSAASFGSFHLIRLLYDEYMFYLVEHKVAGATGETPVAVMGEFIHLGGPNNNSVTEKSPNESAKPTTVQLKTEKIIPKTVVATIPTKNTVSMPLTTPLTSPLTPTVAPRIVNITPGVVNHTTTMQSHSTATAITRVSAITNSNPATVTVVNTAGSSVTPTKTIVVVPVSAAAIGSGDAQPTAKRLKSN